MARSDPVSFTSPAFGWHKDPNEVARILLSFESEGHDPFFVSAARELLAQADDDAPVFFWEAEQLILGKVLKSWNQGQVGTCVSFGYGRGGQDLLLQEIAAGEAERWPGAEVATEPIYAGSRVEVGGGRIRGDGSNGSWAARWVKDWGLLLRQKYGDIDLSQYSESKSREWGRSGCPDVLEPYAREHPVRAVALVQTGDELWTAIGARKPVPVCSGRGFTTKLVGGFCEPKGSWAHCMLFRGRFKNPRRGKSVVIQNSWGGYLEGESSVEVEGVGNVILPQGCFCTTLDVANSMLREKDSFALAGAEGWKKMRWLI